MPKKIVTSPKRKSKMASKARISRGSKEAKEWNLKMQEAKRRKRELRNSKKKMRTPKKTSPRKKGILKIDRSAKNTKKGKKSVRFKKQLEGPPNDMNTISPRTFSR